MLALTATLLFSTALLNTKAELVFADVHIGRHGPYRFMVDTGAQTSLIDEKLAEELGLKPTYTVEVVTQHTTHTMPALRTDNLRVGRISFPETELVYHDLSVARRLDGGVMGVLGFNALSGKNFSLLPRSGRLELSPKRPTGTAVPFRRMEGRIAIPARMDAETLSLILDSGSTHIVLFRTPLAMKRTPPIATTFGTLEGARSVVPTTWTADMWFADELRLGTLPAAIVQRPGTQADGLLPASVFKKIYVDQQKQELVLVH